MRKADLSVHKESITTYAFKLLVVNETFENHLIALRVVDPVRPGVLGDIFEDAMFVFSCGGATGPTIFPR
jgi:hypothetical protein